MKCYMTSGERGEAHKECAAMCIKGGTPMGIIDADGKVYLLIEGKNKVAFEEAKNHAGERGKADARGAKASTRRTLTRDTRNNQVDTFRADYFGAPTAGVSFISSADRNLTTPRGYRLGASAQ